MQHKVTILVSAFCILLLAACDPYYRITVANKTSDTVKLLVKETIHFNTDKQKAGITVNGLDVYKLAPAEWMRVRYAIAEIDNDLPFDTLKIVRNTDTLAANNAAEIKGLFDKKRIGGLKKPYNISIK